MDTITEIAELFERKYDEAITDGATDEQAIAHCRALWIGYLTKTR